MNDDETDSSKKKRERESITRNEFLAAAKDLDLLKTLGNLSESDEDLGTGLREIQYSLQQELEAEKPPPRSSVYKGLRRLKSADLVREKVRRIPPTELPRYRGWRVKRNEETKELEVAENGKIEVQYGFELTSRGEDVVKFLEEHLESKHAKKKQEDESGDNKTK